MKSAQDDRLLSANDVINLIFKMAPRLIKRVNSSLWKRVIAWERSRAASGYGIVPGDADQTRRNLVRKVTAWIVVVTARFKQSYR